MKCPECGGEMEDGYIPLLRGIHWREKGEPIGLAPAWGGLPETGVVWSRKKLQAFRCRNCELVCFQYGSQAKHL
jgi:hypothetical protein